jgi:hypothetical protein
MKLPKPCVYIAGGVYLRIVLPNTSLEQPDDGELPGLRVREEGLIGLRKFVPGLVLILDQLRLVGARRQYGSQGPEVANPVVTIAPVYANCRREILRWVISAQPL